MKLALLILLSAIACARDFVELAKLYDYDRDAPVNFGLKEIEARDGCQYYSVRFALPKGTLRSAFLVVPIGFSGRRPAIVWMHSSGAGQFLGDAFLMARAGAASLLVEAEGMNGNTPEESRDKGISDVIALRRAVDLLQARPDVDPARIAVVGHSYGAMMAAVAASVDKRFRAAVFEVGLLGMSIHIGTSPHPWAEGVRKGLGRDLPHYLEVIGVVDAKHYIGHAPAIPKLFQSAWFDPGVPHKDAEDFWGASTGPKELKWYNSGHDIDDIAALADRARFLGKALGLKSTERVLRAKLGSR